MSSMRRIVRLSRLRVVTCPKAKSQAQRRFGLQNGFTLVEALAAMLVVSMLTALVAATLPAAWRTFESVQRKSNAQVALTTMTAALRDELTMARDIKEPGVGDSFLLKYKRTNGDQMQLIQEDDTWLSLKNLDTDQTTRLVPEALSTKLDMKLDTAITYNEESKVVSISKLDVKIDDTVLASIKTNEGPAYSFRALLA